MEKSHLSIGVDISKQYFDAAFFDGTDATLARYEYTTKGIQKFIAAVRRNTRAFKSYRVIMEGTGSYYMRLAHSLCEAGILTSVVNPLSIKRYGQMKLRRHKTDRADAMLIAEHGFHETPRSYVPPTADQMTISVGLRALSGFMKCKGILSRHIEALSQYPGGTDEVLAIINDIISSITAGMKRLIAILDSKCHICANDDYQRLLAIPGVGRRLASAVIGKLRCFEQFEKAKQVAAYIGMCPRISESGSSVKKSHGINKQGNGYLRTLFYMCSLSATIHNKQCHEYYRRLLARGKAKKYALVAVANKLLRQIFAVVKYKREYDPLYVSCKP